MASLMAAPQLGHVSGIQAGAAQRFSPASPTRFLVTAQQVAKQGTDAGVQTAAAKAQEAATAVSENRSPYVKGQPGLDVGGSIEKAAAHADEIKHEYGVAGVQQKGDEWAKQAPKTGTLDNVAEKAGIDTSVFSMNAKKVA